MVTTEYLEGPISSVALTAHTKYTGLTVKEPLVQPHRNKFHGYLSRITQEYYSSLGIVSICARHSASRGMLELGTCLGKFPTLERNSSENRHFEQA